MKLVKFIPEIKIQPISSSPEKERVKEWYQQTDINDINYSKWLDDILKRNNLDYDLFKQIWIKFIDEWGEGDYGMDWEYFEPTWKWIQTGDESVFDEDYDEDEDE